MNERAYQHNKAASLNRGIDVLLVIKNTPIATTKEIKDQALPYMTIRSVQRYLKTLVQIGLIGFVGGGNDEYRYFLTPKAKQLFGGGPCLDTKEQIRTALIEIAEALGRPHYEPLTVREVLASFDKNTDHPLKAAVLRKIPFLGRKSSIEVVVPKVRTKKPARKASPVEVKKEILKLAQHGTITKFRSGCDCKECMEWA